MGQAPLLGPVAALAVAPVRVRCGCSWPPWFGPCEFVWVCARSGLWRSTRAKHSATRLILAAEVNRRGSLV
jgi:hypothetical protein